MPAKIHAAIRDITAAIGKIAKDGRGPQAQGNFPFMPVEAIIERLQPLVVEHNVILREHVNRVERETDVAIRANGEGQPIYDGRVPSVRVRVEVKISWTFIHVEDGSEFEVINYGEAHDVADKAVRKANTAAYKEMLLRTFWVVAGESDPDSTDPNADVEAQAERRNRGQQKVDNARPTAGRTRARANAAPKVPAPEPEPTPAAVAQPAPAQEPPAAPAQVEPAAPEPEPTGFAPDPEDVKYAEQQAAPPAPAATAAEQRGENISSLKNELRRAWMARGMNRDDVNALGRKLFGVEPQVFLFNATQLKALMKAVEAGEIG